MHVIQGSPKHNREIAELYIAAFPASIKLFFAKKPPRELLGLLELTFRLVFFWGGEAVLAQDEAGRIQGYCLYLKREDLSTRRQWRKFLSTLGQMVGKASLGEVGKLLRNQLVIARSTMRTREIPILRTQARVLSIAINPSCQGQGVGTSLLESALQRLEGHSVGLSVRADNPPARRLYAQAGFQEYGTYRDLSGDWIMLVKDPWRGAE